MTIKQRFEKDCFLACIAMATGITYDMALYLYGDALVEHVKQNGTYGSLITEAFHKVGLVFDRDYITLHHCLVVGEDVVRMPPRTFRDFLWGRRACVQVKSLNFEGEYHIVFWDGHALHDPSNLKTYNAWEQVEPIFAWVFNERKHAA